MCLYFEYKLYRANRTTKINAERFEAFASLNYPPLGESGVNLDFNYQLIYTPKQTNQSLIVRKALCEDVVILKIFPGITENVVRSVLAIRGLKGVVLETYGAGNAPTSSWFLRLLEVAIKSGMYIVNVTQCVGGGVVLGHYETSVGLKSIGVLDGKDITTESAIAKLMYLLGDKIPKENFKKVFETSLRGEIDS